MPFVLISPEALAEYAAFAAEVRHALHERPEIGLDLPASTELIVERLRSFGVDALAENVGGPGVTGTVAVVRGSRPGRTIGLRADGDALPMTEKTGKPWASRIPQRMHACGHDGHWAGLLAAVKYLCEHRDFAGTVVACFQPGEEGYAGARLMIEDGLAERFGIEEFYGLHGDASVPLGCAAFREGYANANSDLFAIRFEGKGGHGSRPQLARDPVVAAAECVMALQTIASRSADPGQAAVVSVGSLQAGDPEGKSVIPQFAELSGTARSFDAATRDLIERRMGEIVQGIALMYGMKAGFEYRRLYPALYNHPEETRFAREAVRRLLGAERVLEHGRRMGGEDFAFMLQRRPGCYFRLGLGDAEHTAGTHNECFDFNDKAFAAGIACLLSVALSRAAA